MSAAPSSGTWMSRKVFSAAKAASGRRTWASSVFSTQPPRDLFRRAPAGWSGSRPSPSPAATSAVERVEHRRQRRQLGIDVVARRADRSGLARSASACCKRSGAPKARASRFCQPRGRPSAASTASNTAWSPSVTVSALARQRQLEQGDRVGHRARIGLGDVGLAEILDAGLEELVAALAALAEHLAEIGIAARRAGAAGDMVEADGDGEFGPQAQRLAGLAFGEEDAAAQILAGHVEERIGRLQDRQRRWRRRRARRRGSGCRGRWRECGRSWRTLLRRGRRPTAPPSVLPDISPSRGEIGRPLWFRQSATSKVGETRNGSQSPPLWGRCPAGQRGARRSAASNRHGGAPPPAPRGSASPSPTSSPSGTVTCAGRPSRQAVLSAISSDSRAPSIRSLICTSPLARSSPPWMTTHGLPRRSAYFICAFMPAPPR